MLPCLNCKFKFKDTEHLTVAIFFIVFCFLFFIKLVIEQRWTNTLWDYTWDISKMQKKYVKVTYKSSSFSFKEVKNGLIEGIIMA